MTDDPVIPSDIEKGHVVKVLTEGDDEYYASVLSNEGKYVFVSYFTPIGKNYKTAPVHSFESKAERVDFESLIEHHYDSTTVGITQIGKNMYVFGDEIDPDSDSEIETEEDTDDDIGSLDDFIVSDTDEGAVDSDHRSADLEELDNQWEQWSPKTGSSKKFKQTIDALEVIAKVQRDNAKF